MEYQYCQNDNFEDFASRRVLYGASGIPNFPVRLGNEILGRCMNYCEKKEDLSLYDPCCGGGYFLTVLGFLNPAICDFYGSDIDETVLKIAEKNLGLLTEDGLQERKKEITELMTKYQKESHREALKSVDRLSKMRQQRRLNQNSQPQICLFHADCTTKLPIEFSPDIIITDVPYGNLVEWQGEELPLQKMYDTLADIATEHTILAVIMDKKQKSPASRWKRLEKQNIGKRKFEIYELLPL